MQLDKPEFVLSAIPATLRETLFRYYNEIIRNFREHKWEPSELNGGKFCETVYTILKGCVDGFYPARPIKPTNMVDACHGLEGAPQPPFSRSLRIQIPRMIIALYEIRNNRGVGHAGGDVNPNHMDAVAVLNLAKWILSELVRLFHNVTPELATSYVDGVVDRTLPVIWEVSGKLRVLRPDYNMMQKTLVLLYHCGTATQEADLFSWAEHSNQSAYRRDVLRRLHEKKFVEYDETKQTITISPLGIREVEEKIKLDF